MAGEKKTTEAQHKQSNTRKNKIRSETMTNKKEQIKTLQAELKHTEKQLVEATENLNILQTYEQFYYERYNYYMAECEKLTKANEELRRNNKKLETVLQGVRNFVANKMNTENKQ